MSKSAKGTKSNVMKFIKRKKEKRQNFENWKLSTDNKEVLIPKFLQLSLYYNKVDVHNLMINNIQYNPQNTCLSGKSVFWIKNQFPVNVWYMGGVEKDYV